MSRSSRPARTAANRILLFQWQYRIPRASISSNRRRIVGSTHAGRPSLAGSVVGISAPSSGVHPGAEPAPTWLSPAITGPSGVDSWRDTSLIEDSWPGFSLPAVMVARAVASGGGGHPGKNGGRNFGMAPGGGG